MVKEQFSQPEPVSYELGLKLRDLEESQKLMRERILLIGNNLIESQEKTSSDIIELKKDVSNLKTDVKRIKEIIESLSEEISKSARKEEVAILSRQFKMFQPLNFARIEDIDKIIDKKLHHKHTHSPDESLDTNQHKFWTGKI